MTAVYAALAGPLTLFGKAHAVGTTCTAPEPNYSTLCEKTQCAWNCKTPTLCPKPKCQLTCEQPGCTEENTFGGASGRIRSLPERRRAKQTVRHFPRLRSQSTFEKVCVSHN